MQYLTSGELAKLLHITKYLLRHYEEQQLIQPAFIDENGYHMYGESEVYTMSHILLLRELGFSLKEIKRILDKETNYTEALSDVLIKVENDIKHLNKLRENVQTVLKLKQKETYKLNIEVKEERYFIFLDDAFVDDSYNIKLKKLANRKEGAINILDEISYLILADGSKVKVMYGSSKPEGDYFFSAGTYYCKRICIENEQELLQEIEHFYEELVQIDAKYEDPLLITEEAQLSAFYMKEMVYSLEVRRNA
ncbi:MerR family transcriptional regulator [Domibacillus indicus]|uniref:MerR family transcriptional regulator n=1 Tax=Domibacillus indicus TaxID=1437523 RepID=UPI000618042E|nr:MerR family transcriptional regulator [Domibacillus indicus]